MITDDDVMHVLERADPARVDDVSPMIDAAGYLDTLRTRSSTVTLIDTEPAPMRRPSRPSWLIGAVAAVVVLIVVGTLVVITRNDATDPEVPTDQPTTVAPDTSSPQEIAEGFLDAYGSFDADRAITYLTDNAIAEMSGTAAGANTRDEFQLELALLEASGYQQTITSCEPPADSSSGITIRCAYDFHSIRSDEMGLGPYSDNYWELTVRDGKIVSAANTIAFMTNGFSEQVWEPFAEWVATEYPQDVPKMYNGGQTNSQLTEESVQLWEQRSREYASPETRVGFVGLPPEGATPSTPERGELVDSYPVNGGGLPFDGMVRLYADGRLIWYRFVNTNTSSTGFLERRLTPEGVELVRTHENLADKDPSRLDEWLPASVWADREIRAYVPFGYAACLSVGNPNAPIEERVWGEPGQPIEQSQLLAALPNPAADLLRARESVPPLDDAEDCLALTTEDARRLDAALRNAGVAQDDQQNAYVLAYRLDYPHEDGARLTIRFEPRFPDGSIGCSDCG